MQRQFLGLNSLLCFDRCGDDRNFSLTCHINTSTVFLESKSNTVAFTVNDLGLNSPGDLVMVFPETFGAAATGVTLGLLTSPRPAPGKTR